MFSLEFVYFSLEKSPYLPLPTTPAPCGSFLGGGAPLCGRGLLMGAPLPLVGATGGAGLFLAARRDDNSSGAFSTAGNNIFHIKIHKLDKI